MANRNKEWTIDFTRTGRPVRVREVEPGECPIRVHPRYSSKQEAQEAFVELKEDFSSRWRRGCRGAQLLV